MALEPGQQRARHQLEVRIKERTADLAQANRTQQVEVAEGSRAEAEGGSRQPGQQ